MLKNMPGTQWRSWIVKWAPRCCEMADKARENHREWRERREEEEEVGTHFKDFFFSDG